MRPLHTDERFGVLLSIAVAIWVAFYFATPASHWFTVRTFEIRDARVWQDVTLDYDRTIHREFKGQWVGKVRRLEPQGWVTYATTPVSTLVYQEDSKLPIPISLEWMLWTEPKAYQLPCGDYEASITWVVNSNSILLRRDITRSARFRIGGPECLNGGRDA